MKTIGLLYLCLSLAFAQAQSARQSLKQNQIMKEFSFLVRVPVGYSREQVQQAAPTWNALLEKWKNAGVYIISFPFPADGAVVSGKLKTVKHESVVTDGFRVVSNIFLRAESLEAAISLANDFPVLEFGGSVEVREIIARPPSN